jgi:hypothetical protein
MLIHHKTSQIEILLHEGNNPAIPAVLVNKHLHSNCEFHRKSHVLQDCPRTKQIYIYTYNNIIDLWTIKNNGVDTIDNNNNNNDNHSKK